MRGPQARGDVAHQAIESAGGSHAVVACMESPLESLRVACLRLLSPVLHHQKLYPHAAPVTRPPVDAAGGAAGAAARRASVAGAKGPSRLRVLGRVDGDASPGVARIVGPGFQSAVSTSGAASAPQSHLTEVLGAMLRSLMQHRNCTLASVEAALFLLSNSDMPSATMTLPESLPVLFAVLRGCDERDRMEGLLQLSLMLKSEPENIINWLRQPGWQLWLLDLIEVEDEFAFLVNAANGRELRSHVDAPTSGRISSGSAAIAADILALLLVAALELDRGWRVWLPTLGCMRQRFGFIKSAAYFSGLSTVVSAVASRLGSQVPEVTAVLRMNVLRTLRIADVRLEGAALARISLSSIPIIRLLRAVAPLSGQELWLVLRLYLRSVEAMAAAGAMAESRFGALSPSSSDASAGYVAPQSCCCVRVSVDADVGVDSLALCLRVCVCAAALVLRTALL